MRRVMRRALIAALALASLAGVALLAGVGGATHGAPTPAVAPAPSSLAKAPTSSTKVVLSTHSHRPSVRISADRPPRTPRPKIVTAKDTTAVATAPAAKKPAAQTPVARAADSGGGSDPTITANPTGSGGGTVSITDNLTPCASPCDASEGDAITITAAPDGDSTFTDWAGGGSCEGQGQSCSFLAGANDEEDDAVFTADPPATYTVTGNSTAGGSVTATSPDGDADCSGDSCTVDSGDDVTLTAKAATGYGFAGWSGDSCSGTDAACDVDDVTSDSTNLATFTATPRYTITGDSAGNGSVTVSSDEPDADCSGDSCTVYEGETVELAATPADRWFVRRR